MTCQNPFYGYIECSLKSYTNDTIDIKTQISHRILKSLYVIMIK